MSRSAAVAAAICLSLAGCTAGHTTAAPASQPPIRSVAPTAPTASGEPSVTADKTVWLCQPGDPHDPCETSLVSTAVLPDGSQRPEGAPTPVATGLDCFYVYPTVSPQQTANADLTVQPAERDTAVAQAARFSSVCRVWAPMYRQRTVHDLFDLAHSAPASPQNLLALASLRAAWRDYLAHDNDGRPIVLIGHSQGASMLIRLIRADIDPDPALRKRIALAILLGGNVTVPDGNVLGGALEGGSFAHLPLCAHKGERGCVIAYSTFPGEPPAFSFFGRAGSGVSPLSGETATDRQVACVNPAAIGSLRAAPLHPYVPSARLSQGAAATTWTSFPDRYQAQCRHSGNATWLQVTRIGGAPDTVLREDLGAAGGYHTVDVTLALGDLVDDVRALASR